MLSAIFLSDGSVAPITNTELEGHRGKPDSGDATCLIVEFSQVVRKAAAEFVDARHNQFPMGTVLQPSILANFLVVLMPGGRARSGPRAPRKATSFGFADPNSRNGVITSF